MPYFRIETSQKMDEAGVDKLLQDASAFLSGLLGKPERVIMVSVSPGVSAIFSKSNAPAAYIQLKSIGLPQEKCMDFSKAICEFMETAIQVPANRIYIDFASINGSMFGWNRQTF